MAEYRHIATSFEDISARCRQHGASIVVHIVGGLPALQRAELTSLRPLPFTWCSDAEAHAQDDDWVPGDLFRAVLHGKRRIDAASISTGPNEDLKNWYDKAWSLNEILAICERHGAQVVVGFEGGRAALRRSTPASLQSRSYYKWDWADRPTGVKDKSNWIPGDEFHAIVREIGA
ncbi:MAG TPA: hypothetical protein VNM91_01375 [Dehalococcoidia bacterium]|nr:hypothetical protein [Dehalococcoidia bacterium]